jgi:hypothetical protein
MSAATKIREVAKDVITAAAKEYDLHDPFSNKDFREECEDSLYEFLKYTYGGTDPAYLHLALRPEGKKYFIKMYKQEAAWLLIGATLPDQNQYKVKIPDFLWERLPGLVRILPQSGVIEWPHPKGEKFIPEDIIKSAIEAYRSSLS